MGTVYRKTATKPLPAAAERFDRHGEPFARWKDAKGKPRTAAVIVGRDGSPRVVVTARTFTAKYRDGRGIVHEAATGCRTEQAARAVLSDLERRAELVKAGVVTAADEAVAVHNVRPLAEHFADYAAHLELKGVSPVRRKNMASQFRRVGGDCGFRRLCDLAGEPLAKWLAARKAEGMSAATRNGYRETFVMFAGWASGGLAPRMTGNPFVGVPKANVRTDRRRHRRAMTAAELARLLHVARLRPLADYGRGTVAAPAAERRGRATWRRDELTFNTIDDDAAAGRERLAGNPPFLAARERIGRERALIYKTLVLTGLRKNELASLTIGRCRIDGPTPCLELDAADEKNRQGSLLPLPPDLAADLRAWLADRAADATAERPGVLRLTGPPTLPADAPLFDVPAGLVRILDRDLRAAGIAKADDRGRSLDVHALRQTFGTLLSMAGVAPRTAQAAMRHSSIDLTMNVYTDPRLLDVTGAVGSLPTLPLAAPPADAAKATGTTGRTPETTPQAHRPFAPAFAPTGCKPGHSESIRDNPFTVAGAADGSDAAHGKPRKRQGIPVFPGSDSSVGATRRLLNFSWPGFGAAKPACGDG